MFAGASHVALCVMVFGYVHSGFNKYSWSEASDTVFCCQGGLLFLIDVHLNPVGAVCGEVAVVVFVELALMVT